MEFLHNQAKAKGASKVRLKVYSNNAGAQQLYESLGYSFSDEENGQLIGYCDL
jgi:ribosomal protein S18 acetylase RimI-like enzyme